MGAVVGFSSKLVELRARTDRDVVRIMHADLDRALARANVAATKRSVFREQAEAVYNHARDLLPKLSGLTEWQLAGLDIKLKELGMALDLVPGTMDLESDANQTTFLASLDRSGPGSLRPGRPGSGPAAGPQSLA